MKTLYDKIWDAHVVVPETDAPAILYIDIHLIHEVTTPQAFSGLKKRGLKVRRTDKTFGTMDHSIPTSSRSLSGFDEMAARQVQALAHTLPVGEAFCPPTKDFLSLMLQGARELGYGPEVVQAIRHAAAQEEPR